LNALKNDLKDENKNQAYKIDEIIEHLITGPINLTIGNNQSTGGGPIYEKSSTSLISTISSTTTNNSKSRTLSPRHIQANIQSESSRSTHSASSSSSQALTTTSSASTSASSSSNNINSLITSDFNLDQFKQQNNLIDFTSSSSLSYKQLSSYDHNNLTSRTNTSESTLTNDAKNNNNNNTITNDINFINISNKSNKNIFKSTSVSSLLDLNNDGGSTSRTNQSHKSSLTQFNSLRNDFESLNLDSNRFGTTSSSTRNYFTNNLSNNTSNNYNNKFQQSITLNSQDLSNMSNNGNFLLLNSI
jgi:hypothetical protein